MERRSDGALERQRGKAPRLRFGFGCSDSSLRRSGFTLVEMLVVAAIIAIVLAIAIGSLRALSGQVQEDAARSALRALLASARTEAQARQHMVGVRFQQDAAGNTLAVVLHPVAPDTPAYSLYDPTRLYEVFTAASGREPVRFPKGVELAVDPRVDRDGSGSMDDLDANLSLTTYLADTTTFTILFAPNGQLAIRRVMVVQRDNRDSIFYGPDYPPDVPANLRDSAPVPRLLRDDRVSGADPNLSTPAGLPAPPTPVQITTPNARCFEFSVNSLWVYDQTARREAGATPWTTYLKQRESESRFVVNTYTGQLMKPGGQ